MSAPVKRTRPAEFLRKRAALLAREQRKANERARRLVGWRRSR
jgi:hypothetical protein